MVRFCEVCAPTKPTNIELNKTASDSMFFDLLRCKKWDNGMQTIGDGVILKGEEVKGCLGSGCLAK